jgi:hypothetical protein
MIIADAINVLDSIARGKAFEMASFDVNYFFERKLVQSISISDYMIQKQEMDTLASEREYGSLEKKVGDWRSILRAEDSHFEESYSDLEKQYKSKWHRISSRRSTLCAEEAILKEIDSERKRNRDCWETQISQLSRICEKRHSNDERYKNLARIIDKYHLYGESYLSVTEKAYDVFKAVRDSGVADRTYDFDFLLELVEPVTVDWTELRATYWPRGVVEDALKEIQKFRSKGIKYAIEYTPPYVDPSPTQYLDNQQERCLEHDDRDAIFTVVPLNGEKK